MNSSKLLAEVTGLVCAFALTSAPALALTLGERCVIGDVTPSADGLRRLALVVGVADYRAPSIEDLAGPVNDANSIYELLTAAAGYGFPRENVCVLLDAEATTANFKQAFEEGLTARATGGDIVAIFYAGHGSQAPDVNGDEPDERDETFMLHDARTDGVGDLLDDEFNALLAELHTKTQNITILLDSCNSGSATRAAMQEELKVRFQDMAAAPAIDTQATGFGDGGSAWVPESLPGVVTLTAASDGTSAIELRGRGVFTYALLKVMREVGARPLTYRQVARRVKPVVSSAAYQIPHFQGELDKVVFGNTVRKKPIAWEVTATGEELVLSGPPLAGVGVGAEFRIFDGNAEAGELRDPAQSKAVAVVHQPPSGLQVNTKMLSRAPEREIALGDLALLVRPGDEAGKVRVHLRAPQAPGGLPAARAAAIRAAVEASDEARMLVELVDPARDGWDFELHVRGDGLLQLTGADDKFRNLYERDEVVAENLWQHARQRSLLQLRGEGGAGFIDHETLAVQIVRAAEKVQGECAEKNKRWWRQSAPNEQQVIPLCTAWNIRVTLDASAPVPMLIGGVILSSDGSVYGFPVDGRTEKLEPGNSVTFKGRGETFRATPPLDVEDQVIVFGTQEQNPVPWRDLTSTAKTRAGGNKSALYRALDRYLKPGARSRGVTALKEPEPLADSAWTLSVVSLRVEANPRFVTEGARTSSSEINLREYTVADFDIRPYLPNDTGSALHQVLTKADWLAGASRRDGFGYQQHQWHRSSDEENLKHGIDCSRAIWYAFTRAGLPYNRDDEYLPTAQMVDKNGLMADEFERCDQTELALGDVLVYRDDGQGDGHTVMVIDPVKRIAWGSHGWDGNAKALKIEADTGVEYQKIKVKKDWQRWDRQTMTQRACWRHKRFADANAQANELGVNALRQVCAVDKGCGKSVATAN